MKCILVTGGNKGIGLAIVTKLLKDHADTFVFLGSRDANRGQTAVQGIIESLGEPYKNRLELIQLDVTSDESVANAVKHIRNKYQEDSQPLYGVINNAGGFLNTPRGTIDLNTYGVHRVCEAFLPLLQKENGKIQVL